MHEILIVIVIIAIVALQIWVAFDTFKKINLFKMIIPSESNFETVKVFIPESQIKNIKVDHILSNLKSYSTPYDQAGYHEIVIEDNDREIERDLEDEKDKQSEFPILNRIEENENALVWIGKGTDEKRIELRLLKSFELLGWNRIE